DEASYVDELQPFVTERTKLAGRYPRSAMPPIYRGAGVYINASLHEGSSNAVLEAISAGCPILLSNIPENLDFGLPPHCYFDPHDPAAIGAAIERALRDPKAFVANPSVYMSWDDVAARTLDIYRRIAPPPEAAPERSRVR